MKHNTKARVEAFRKRNRPIGAALAFFTGCLFASALWTSGFAICTSVSLGLVFWIALTAWAYPSLYVDREEDSHGC